MATVKRVGHFGVPVWPAGGPLSVLNVVNVQYVGDLGAGQQ